MSGEVDKKALDIAIDLTKQLITLATAMVTFLATLVGVFKPLPSMLVGSFATSLYFELCSILFGLLTYGAIIAVLNKEKKFDVAYSWPTRWFAVVQWIFFALGIVFLLLGFIQIR